MIRDGLRRIPRSPATKFCAVWFVVTFIFFSLAGSKRSVYLLPAYPALAVLTARWWALRVGDTQRSATVTAVVAITALVLSLPAVVGGLHAIGIPLLEQLKAHVSAGDAANLPAVAAALDAHRVWIAVWALAVWACLYTTVEYARRGRLTHAFAGLAIVASASFTVLSAAIMPGLAAGRSPNTFIEELNVSLPSDAALSFYDGVDYGAVFYRHQPIPRRRPFEQSPPQQGEWLLVWGVSLEALREELQANGPENAAQRSRPCR